MIKMYLTINDKFCIPNLIHYLRSYIKGCHIHQLTRNEKPPSRQLQTRINLNYSPLSRLSMDLKVMQRSSKGHKFILCIIDEVTNYLIMVPVYHSKVEEVDEALIECDNKVLYPQLYHQGSGQHICVLPYELPIQ